MYGKLEENRLIYAPNPVIYDGKCIYNPPAELLSRLGYKPIVKTEYPKDDRHYRQEWHEAENVITPVWVDDEDGYWQSIPYDEAVDAEIRQRYSVSQEFAILRQKEEKPDEYEAYFTYCEECKDFVKRKRSEV